MIKEEDIRKRDSLARYLELVAADCTRLLSAHQLAVVACPACEGEDSTFEFRKQGFEYHTCLSCQTLFARTRPDFHSLEEFYTHSEATTYWINEFFKPVAEARRQKIFVPRAEYVANRFGNDPAWCIGDIGAGFGIFCDELRRLWPKSSYIAIEPSPEQAEICRNSGIEVIQKPVEAIEDSAKRFDFLTAFEILEHLHSPRRFVAIVRDILKPGGWLLLTSLNGLGFDIQVLWERSKNVYPPCHINFLNPHSLSQMLEGIGFRVHTVETPGQLDWDIVQGAIEHHDAQPERFWKVVAQRVGPAGKQGLQKWIRENSLSSHMRVLAQRI